MTDENKQSPTLPPSDGGGADWAVTAAAEIMALNYPTTPAIDNISGIIRKHAPTQQPAEQPEAGELKALIEAVESFEGIDLEDYDDATQHNFNSGFRALIGALLKAKAFLATPRPESPDAQRGELLAAALGALKAAHAYTLSDRKAEDDRRSESGASPVEWPTETPYQAVIGRIERALSARPAKGPGPRSDESDDYWRGYRSRLDEEHHPVEEPKHPTLWRYLQNAFEKKITFHAIGVNRMSDGGFHFYIHPQGVSGDTEDYLVWPDPFNWSDMIVNKKSSPAPDFEKFKAHLAKTFPAPPPASHSKQREQQT